MGAILCINVTGHKVHPPDELLTSHLRAVSRSLYPSLRILPPSIRPQLSVAYLLARAADFIRKPVKNNVLLARVSKALKQEG